MMEGRKRRRKKKAATDTVQKRRKEESKMRASTNRVVPVKNGVLVGLWCREELLNLCKELHSELGV
jgi:hypothetical protein